MRYLITGGTGSLGQAITNKLLTKSDIRTIRIYSRNEFSQVEMERKFDDKRLRFLIGDVRDKDRLSRACNKVDYIIDCAALKHVPVCEYNPIEAIKTNIMGAVNLIDCAIDNKVKAVIHISTDKAVSPVNLYGATKLVAEKIFIQGNVYGDTMFSCVRFGNFIGSSGSVIPLFLKQKSKGVLTVTDPHMVRYWITLDEGADFALRMLHTMRGGEIFIPKMRKLSVEQWKDIIAPEAEVKIVGIRNGEKMEEDLYTEEEQRRINEFDDYYVIWSE